MRSSNLLFSCVNLTVTLLIIAFGLCLLIVPYAESVRYALANFFLSNPAILFSLGLLTLSLGISLLVGFFFMHNKRYYKVGLECGKASIEEAIIKDYIKAYWKNLFPGYAAHLEVTLGVGQKIEIITKLPETVENNQQLFD